MTDAFGERNFMDRTVVNTATDIQNDSFLHKELEIKAFAIYLDENTPFAVTMSLYMKSHRQHLNILIYYIHFPFGPSCVNPIVIAIIPRE